MQDPWAARFPELFRPRFETYAGADLAFRVGAPLDELVARIHVIALDEQGHVVVCRSVEGWRFLPGGTREPGESLTDLVRRELLEEAGCTLLDEPDPVFAYTFARSRRPAPYRPHLPHPESAWAYAVARVEQTGDPANPPDGETVVEVLALPAEEAAAWLAEWDEIEQAPVVRLAIAMGLLTPDRSGRARPSSSVSRPRRWASQEFREGSPGSVDNPGSDGMAVGGW